MSKQAKLQAEIDQLRAEVAELQTLLDEERSRLRVRDVEIDELAAVIARNRERIKAETAAYGRQAIGAEK